MTNSATVTAAKAPGVMLAKALPTIFQRESLTSHASSARVTIIDIARFNQVSKGFARPDEGCSYRAAAAANPHAWLRR
ncbi:hypothetical protein ACVDG8_006015 [Mesorhizobium sp. ORM8.1]